MKPKMQVHTASYTQIILKILKLISVENCMLVAFNCLFFYSVIILCAVQRTSSGFPRAVKHESVRAFMIHKGNLYFLLLSCDF